MSYFKYLTLFPYSMILKKISIISSILFILGYQTPEYISIRGNISASANTRSEVINKPIEFSELKNLEIK